MATCTSRFAFTQATLAESTNASPAADERMPYAIPCARSICKKDLVTSNLWMQATPNSFEVVTATLGQMR